MLLLFLFLCTEYVPLYVYVEHRLYIGILFFCCSPSLFLRQGFSLNLEFAVMFMLRGQHASELRDPPVSSFTPVLTLQGNFYASVGVANLSPHARIETQMKELWCRCICWARAPRDLLIFTLCSMINFCGALHLL